ncbi:MAG: hypothetical protein LUC90_04205 [Lachnospiraceae bacterium]|nr:hypothetical protein [Lachnospiraceae bacterium]
MNTFYKNTEKISDLAYEWEKENLKQFINDDIPMNTCSEIFLVATHYLIGLFKSRGSVPVSLLEYAYKESQEKEKRGRKYVRQ